MADSDSPKATRRHEKISRSKKQEIEDLEGRIRMEESSLRHYKEDRAGECRKLPKEDRAAHKQETSFEVAKKKENIASLKEEHRFRKKEYKEDSKKIAAAFYREEVPKKKAKPSKAEKQPPAKAVKKEGASAKVAEKARNEGDEKPCSEKA